MAARKTADYPNEGVNSQGQVRSLIHKYAPMNLRIIHGTDLHFRYMTRLQEIQYGTTQINHKTMPDKIMNKCSNNFNSLKKKQKRKKQ